jgi:pullulanase
MRRSQYLIFIALLYLFRITPAPVSAASPAGQNTVLVGNIKQARAYWVNRDTLAWFGADPNDTYQLYYSADAGITDVATGGVEGDGYAVPLAVDPNGLPQTIIDKFPFLKGATSFKIPASQLAQVPALLKDQLVLVNLNGSKPVDATSLQLPGVVDDLFYFDGRLGANPLEDGVRFRLWAPTAQKVRLFVYDDPRGTISTVYPMSEGLRGVWETKAATQVGLGTNTTFTPFFENLKK